jgi:imidazoleglycerol phosphate dehydratase HisB
MVEHIAWRLGIGIDLAWPDTNWGGLGDRLGRQIRQFEARQPRAAALGMIDDGSAEVYLDLEGEAGFVIEAIANTDLDWFLALRCEQLDSGRPLIELLAGLTAGLGGRLQIRVCSVEDPHHTWEGIFRSVGIALARLFMPAPPPSVRLPSERGIAAAQGQAQGQGRLEVREGTADSASVVRETAESIVSVRAVLAEPPGLDCAMAVAESIDVAAFPRLLERLALAAGLALSVSFTATKLNSSHVVLEDIGLVLGRALLEIFRHRMEGFGVNGAGSSVKTLADYSSGAVRVGVSIEGRKFVKFVPFTASTQSMRKGLLVGPLVYGSIRAEDLDDFLDGLAGGLACSIIVHLRSFDDPEATWAALFEQLGLAIRECLEPNPYRKGLPAGVKATLI